MSRVTHTYYIWERNRKKSEKERSKIKTQTAPYASKPNTPKSASGKFTRKLLPIETWIPFSSRQLSHKIVLINIQLKGQIFNYNLALGHGRLHRFLQKIHGCP